MKNIILSTDGTGNAGGKGYGTNVWRLHTAIDRHSHLSTNNKKQIAFYHDGVGSQDSKWRKIVTGALGIGLERTVLELYTYLVNNYDHDDDQIYLFGFSRGAYTVRILAGMIVAQGILDRKEYANKSDVDLENAVKDIYRKFKNNIIEEKEKRLSEQKTRFSLKWLRMLFTGEETHCTYKVHKRIKIKFMGVWDTVDAYAIPSDTLAQIADRIFYTSFRQYDNFLSESVESACHALSIDDQRRTFEPVLWREKAHSSDDERIKQVWFAGVHSNVGGGYPKQGMAWITLEWMMQHAKCAGLRFVAEDIAQYVENKDIQDKLYDSRSGFGSFYLHKIRDIGRLWQVYVHDNTATTPFETSVPKIHISVFERIATRAEAYAPMNFPDEFEIVETPIADQKGKRQDSICRQYNRDEIQALTQQVKQALRGQDKSELKLSEKIYSFINRRHAAICIGIVSAYWLVWVAVKYKYIEAILFPPLLTALLLSLLVWPVLWYGLHYFAKKDKLRIKKFYSGFWREVSANETWNFLR